MARVLLIQPPLSMQELFARGAKTSASVIPPLGLAYIAAYLRQFGHPCRIIDGIARPQSLETLAQEAAGYDLVGITVNSAYTLRAIELIQHIKTKASCPPVVVGGPHVTALPESLFAYGADYAVIGEGEQTMRELVECLAAGGGGDRLRAIRGIGFCENGEYVFTKKRPRIEPLDQVPLPARDLLPMHLYRSSISRASAQPSHSMLTSRGCPGVCTFCSKLTHGTRVRHFSVPRIVEEFFLLRDRYGARDIAVWDDNFLSNQEVVLAVCDVLRSRKFGISFSVEARIDGVNRRVLKALKAAGCTYIAYGVESGSQRVLDYVNKRITKQAIRETVAMTREVGIPMRGYFMIGLPTELPEEMDQTIRFAKELDPQIASFTLFVPLPGTVEYRRAQRSGVFDKDYFLHRLTTEFNFLDVPIYVPEGMSPEELLKIHRSAYNRYYFRPKAILKKLRSIRSLGDFYTLLQGGYTLLANAFTSLGSAGASQVATAQIRAEESSRVDGGLRGPWWLRRRRPPDEPPGGHESAGHGAKPHGSTSERAQGS